MSIRARILNYALKKYVKKVQLPVEDRSYLEARKMMNQKGYEDTNSSIVNTSLQKFIFNKKISKIQTNEIYLENIRTLSFDHEELSKDKCILYFHGGGYIAGSPETHQNLLTSIAEKSNLKVYASKSFYPDTGMNGVPNPDFFQDINILEQQQIYADAKLAYRDNDPIAVKQSILIDINNKKNKLYRELRDLKR